MKYRATCNFPKRDNLNALQLDIEASNPEQCRILARARCLVAGYPLPREIKITQIEWIKKKDCD